MLTLFRTSAIALCIIVAPVLVACGAGVAGVIAGTGGSGSGGTPTVLTSFDVVDPKVSPATIRIAVVGQAPVTARLFFQAPGGAREPLTQLDGLADNSIVLREPEVRVLWSFAAEPGLQGDHFVDGVRLELVFPGDVVPDNGVISLGMGNDPPEILEVRAPPAIPGEDESAGVLPIDLRVRDSSSDVVSILAEWRHTDEPEDAWKRATAAGVFPAGVETTPAGVDLTFFWDTNVDLLDQEDDVVVRITPDDRTLDGSGNRVGVGDPVASPAFRVDNNSEPVLFLDEIQLAASSDHRRDIPIGLRIADEERDRIQVVGQWRRALESFPALPDDLGELAEALADPARRRELHILDESPQTFEGRLEPLGLDSVRLPELGSSAAGLLASGIVSTELIVLRATQTVKPLQAASRGLGLSTPVGVLPVGDGKTALVLDAPAAGWRLREIDLTTVAVVPGSSEVALLAPESPQAMTYERDQASVLVAGDDQGAWKIWRVDLQTAEVAEVARSDGTTDAGSIGGIASVAPGVALATIANRLMRVDYGFAAKSTRLLDHLRSPGGILLDPSDPLQLYVTERGSEQPGDVGRIMLVDLETLAMHTLGVRPGGAVLARPSSLAFEDLGNRLLIAADADPDDGRGELLAYELHDPGKGEIYELLESAGRCRAVGAGPDGLRIAVLSSPDDLAAGGGITHRTRIQSYDPVTRVAIVLPPFRSLPEPGSRWRIAPPSLAASAPTGAHEVFLWDTSSFPAGAELQLRFTPVDTEPGTPIQTLLPVKVDGPLQTDPVLVAPGAFSGIDAGDIDGDGNLDVVAADSQQAVLVFLQTGTAGVFAQTADLGDLGLTPFPQEPIVADLDSDGQADILVRNDAPPYLTAFLGSPDGSFGGTPIPSDRAEAVALTDIDIDGDLDLLTSRVSLDFPFPAAGVEVLSRTVTGYASSLMAVTSCEFFNVVTTGLAGGDIDLDGDPDIACAQLDTNGQGCITLMHQGPELSFAQSATPFFFTSFLTPTVQIIDYDDDRVPDVNVDGLVLLSRATGFDLAFLPLTGRLAHVDDDLKLDVLGVFGGIAYGLPGGEFTPTSEDFGGFGQTAVDFNGDKWKDILYVDQDGIRLLYSDSAGTIDAEPTRLSVRFEWSSIASADMDNDGDRDLVAGVWGPWIHVVFQDGPRFFSSDLALATHPDMGVRSAHGVDIADIDADGDMDLVSAFFSGSGLSIHYQDDSGRFEERAAGNIASPPCESISSADVDSNGLADLVALQTNTKTLVFMQVEPDNFVLSTPVLNAAKRDIDVEPADLDKDGKQDLVVLRSNLRFDFWFVDVFFQGEDGFANVQPVSFTVYSGSFGEPDLEVADWNGDAYLDIAATDEQRDDVIVFLQSSPRKFSPLPQGVLPVQGRVVNIRAADMDRDGDDELLAFEGVFVSVFSQTAPGALALQRRWPIQDSVQLNEHQCQVADFDGDGEIDIALPGRTPIIHWGGE